MKLGTTFLFIALILKISLAQVANYSNDFLQINSSARAIAMGGSVLTSAFGAEALFYNPANLTNLENFADLTITHSNYFASAINYDYLAVALKGNKTNFAIGYIRLAAEQIPNTLYIYNGVNFDLSNISYFNISDNALLIAVSRKLPWQEKLAFGIKTKLIFRNLGPFANGYGFGIDLAASYKTKTLSLAATINDITGTFTAWFFSLDDSVRQVFVQTGNQLPQNTLEISLPNGKIAAAKAFKHKKLNFLFEANLLFTLAQQRNFLLSSKIISASPTFGTEISYNNVFFLRLGAYNFQRLTVLNDTLGSERLINFWPSFGLGIKYKNFRFDYSLANFLNQQVPLQSHFFTVGYSFASVPRLKRKNSALQD